MVFDSGEEQITAELLPTDFNSTNDENASFDSRSDDKGPEPEGVAIAELYSKTSALTGLERVGGVMVYDVSDPQKPQFATYIDSRDFGGDAVAGTAGDLGPEGLAVIAPEDSPNGRALLVVGNEVSGTTSIFQIGGLIADASTVDEIAKGSDDQGTDADALRMYRAFFDRDPDVGGAKYWIGESRKGADLDDLAFGFANSAEFLAKYGTLTNEQFIDRPARNPTSPWPGASVAPHDNARGCGPVRVRF